MRAGSPETLTYSVDGSTTATVTLTNVTGVVRKTIATYAVESGARSVTFDGRSDDGQVLPDGVYTATVVSNDPYGTSTQQSKPVRIDGTAPQIVVIPPATPQDPIQVTATDPSGVSALSAGTPTSFYEGSSPYSSVGAVTKTTTVSAPSTGWEPGSTVRIDVSAQDSLGNTAARAARAVVIPGGTSPALTTKLVNALSSTPTRQKRSTVARRGLRVSGRGSGRVRITIRVTQSVARSLRSRSTTLAVKTVTASGGRFSVLIKLSPTVRRALRRRSRTTMTVSASGGATARKSVAIVR